MTDYKQKAYSRERTFRLLSHPWFEMITEIRAERAALLEAPEFDNMAGVEKAERLDVVDSRLKTAQEWVNHYEHDRIIGAGFRMRKWLRVAKTLSDSELGLTGE
tara:strand:- start:478 stop:789 length:312 start_codon:yes stop_codon:yes gene_type:complete